MITGLALENVVTVGCPSWVSVELGLGSSLSASVISRPELATPSSSRPKAARGPHAGGGPLAQFCSPFPCWTEGCSASSLHSREQGSPTLDSLSPGRELHAMLKARWDLGTSVGVPPWPWPSWAAEGHATGQM